MCVHAVWYFYTRSPHVRTSVIIGNIYSTNEDQILIPGKYLPKEQKKLHVYATCSRHIGPRCQMSDTRICRISCQCLLTLSAVSKWKLFRLSVHFYIVIGIDIYTKLTVLWSICHLLTDHLFHFSIWLLVFTIGHILEGENCHSLDKLKLNCHRTIYSTTSALIKDFVKNVA